MSYTAHRAAVEFMLPLRSAALTKLQRVRQQLLELAGELQDDIDTAIACHAISSNLPDVIKKQLSQVRALKQDKNIGAGITEAQIIAARAFPIERLIDFRNGEALAWCHDDTNPSLTWDRKHNRAHCFVCDESFNSIDTLMRRDGMNFTDAVKMLAP